MWFKLGLGFVLAAITEAVKNPQKKLSLKEKLLDLRNQINALYPGE
jgi:hypothetical protein